MNNQQSAWVNISSAYKAYAQALQDFLALSEEDRIRLMKMALQGKDRITAIHLLQYLPQPEKMQMFDELVYLSSFSHGAIRLVRQELLSFPRDWVIARIEQFAEPYLDNGTYDEYRRFMELYIELDHDLALRLARRASKHQDLDVKEVGEEFLKNL